MPCAGNPSFVTCVADELTQLAKDITDAGSGDYARAALGPAISAMYSAACAAGCRSWAVGSAAVDGAAESIHGIGLGVGALLHDEAQRFRDLGYEILSSEERGGVCARLCVVE